MTSQPLSLLEPPPVGALPAQAAPDAEPRGQARAGLALSVATFAMAAASAIQAVLYLSLFGTNEQTDGFFVAFALYATFGVFSQSLRLTAVPLLVEPGARITARQFAAALALIAAPILLFAGPLAGLSADILAPGLSPAGRSVTESALPILGIATVLQLWTAGCATLLAIRGRFGTIATGYILGAAGGLITFIAVESFADELTLGWSMLAMSILAFGSMSMGLRASGGFGQAKRGSLAPSGLVRTTGLLLSETIVYLAFNGLFVITMAVVSKSDAGDTTVLSYSYLFASYLVAGTGMALGMSRISEMTRAARSEARALVAASVPQGFRYAMLVVAPALAALIAAGAPLIHEVLPGSLDAAGVHALRQFTALLVAWTVAALLVNLLLPALFALGRGRLVNILAIPLVVLHVVATIVGGHMFGAPGAVAAFCIAPILFALIALLTAMGPEVAGSTGRELALDALRFLGLAAVAYGVADGLGAALTDGIAQSAFALIVGTALYGGGLLIVARQQVGVVAGALRPATT